LKLATGYRLKRRATSGYPIRSFAKITSEVMTLIGGGLTVTRKIIQGTIRVIEIVNPVAMVRIN
jgi:hypothetical protein